MIRPTNTLYQYKPSPWSSHSLIADQLRRLPEGSKVLDVGTATGTLGKLSQGLGLRLYGIEPDPDWAELAKEYYIHIQTCKVEDAPVEYLSDYTTIVFADILEHTPDPEKILRTVIALQAKGTKIIVSVPNIANVWVRINMLLGRFEYHDRGILDKTHLRFFTKSVFIQLLERCGLEISFIKPTPIPLELISPFFNTRPGFFLYKIFAGITMLFPTLLGFQFVAGARKR